MMTKSNPGLSRRDLIAAAGLAPASALADPKPAAQAKANGGQGGFLWGVATAGHQVEGGNLNSDMWLLEHLAHSPFSEKSGDALDHYHRYAEDIALAAKLGFNTYRFSIEWSRVEPEPGEFSAAEIDHYRRMCAACREHGLIPALTYNHFSAPRWFAAQGGWENPEAPALFARYCEKVTARLGEFAGLASTLNEPNMGLLLQWILPAPVLQQMRAAMVEAAKAAASDRFSAIMFGRQELMLPNLLAAHRQGYAAIKAGPGDFPVGVSLSLIDDQPLGPNSRVADKRRQCYEPWLAAAAADGDFIGVQTYGRARIDDKGQVEPPPGAELTQMGEEFYPQALERTIRYAYAATQKPVYVTENGIATEDDDRRIAYINEALKGVGACLADGLPVRGYIHWSLMDNFEWVFGYRPKFGLVAVDRATQKRTPKRSGRLLGEIAKSGRAPGR